MLKVGIVGARGYTGEELIDILIKHTQLKLNYLTARVPNPTPISDFLPKLKGRLDLNCCNFNLKESLELCDLLFLCLPHTQSMDIAPSLVSAGKKVIDLSADYRIKDARLYEAWYKVEHKDYKGLKTSVYGLPEIYGVSIKKASLVANPGCYPTAAILALAPLLKSKTLGVSDIIIDAKSGYSGAGRKSPNDPFWKEIKNNFKAYKVDSHQHSPEINQELSGLSGKKTKVIFVPHLLSIERGILETIYVKIKNPKANTQDLIGLYRKFYKNKPFIRIKDEGEFPQIKDVLYTNYCDIGLKVNVGSRQLIIVSTIDNLLKGASGQAVQNMNLMCGFKETESLL